MGLEIYVHIPFCIKKCHYCDFLSFPAEEAVRDRYCLALEKEIHQTAVFLGSEKTRQDSRHKATVSTVFIGGGTPSILSGKQMMKIMDCLRDHFSFRENVEITIEANPGTLDAEKLKLYREAGINRLSMGLQSTDNASLHRLGRIHTWEQGVKNYQEARKAGFSNINLDLMSALPGQDLCSYVDGLKKVTELEPEHISSYSLILEEGTPFFSSKEIRRQLPDEETEREMYEKTKEILQEKGYHRYEISNYAKAGRECRHNLGYWDEVPYLGFGLGASSCYGGARFSNERDILTYMAEPFRPFEKREDYARQSRKEQMEDYMIFGLRKTKGVSLSRFDREYGCAWKEIYGEKIRRYEKIGLLIIEGDNLKLTDAGIDVSNRIFEDFLL